MKITVSIVLFLFISFLLAPTIISLLEKNKDISMFYSSNEEELQKDFKEIKADFINEYEFVFVKLFLFKNSKITSENLSSHDKVFEEIFSPPPELV
jgi:hypothetical protein